MSKATLGPWSHRNGRIFQADRPELTIANVARAHDGDYSQTNGDLLAAAPELLEALILMVRTHEEPAETMLQEMRELQWIEQSYAAIAKATGGPRHD